MWIAGSEHISTSTQLCAIKSVLEKKKKKTSNNPSAETQEIKMQRADQ